MPTDHDEAKTLLTFSQVNTIHVATGMSQTRIRHCIKTNTRPTNPLLAAAWDEVVRELGLVKP